MVGGRAFGPDLASKIPQDVRMNRREFLVAAGLALVLAGCGPNQPPPPEPDEDLLEHLRYFGAEAKASDITWRPSGLGVRLLAPGDGAAPRMTDTVRVHYVGRLKDGKVFDDSHRRGAPSDFVVGQLIPGWAAAMPALKPGGRAQFFIPPVLGYGPRQAGDIPPNSGLIFEVELIAVNLAPAQK